MAWALGGGLQTTSDIVITGPLSPTPLGTENFNRFQVGAGYGFGLPYDMDLGFMLSVAGYRFMGQQRAAWGLDLGLVPYQAGDFSTGVVVRNLIRPTFSFADDLEDTWARTFVLAGSWQRSGATMAAEVEFSDLEDTRFRAGGEYQVAEPLALRAGFDGFGPTAGASVRYKRFRIDYAFVSPSELGTEHRIGLSIDLGRPIAVQRRLRAEQIDYEVADAMERRRTEQKPELESQGRFRRGCRGLETRDPLCGTAGAALSRG